MAQQKNKIFLVLKWIRPWYLPKEQMCFRAKMSCSVSVVVAQMVKNPPVKQDIQVWSLSQEDPLEKERATHFSILSWRTPWTEEPGRPQSMGSQRVRHDLATKQQVLQVGKALVVWFEGSHKAPLPQPYKWLSHQITLDFHCKKMSVHWVEGLPSFKTNAQEKEALSELGNQILSREK